MPAASRIVDETGETLNQRSPRFGHDEQLDVFDGTAASGHSRMHPMCPERALIGRAARKLSSYLSAHLCRLWGTTPFRMSGTASAKRPLPSSSGVEASVQSGLEPVGQGSF